MEKPQYELCIKVLRRLHSAGILDEIIIVGSWCLPFYKDYFTGFAYRPLIRTRDVDLLIPFPSAFKKHVDVADLLKEFGFIVGFTGRKGFIRLEHPELIIEFLVPEKGRGTDKPYPLPKLGVNAQALRFLDFLAKDAITVVVNDIPIRLPHPVHFCLHKMILLQRRSNKEKSEKDAQAASYLLSALIEKGETEQVKKVFNSMPPHWRQMVRKAAKIVDVPGISKLLA